jgi:Rap1a immunity proteins
VFAQTAKTSESQEYVWESGNTFVTICGVDAHKAFEEQTSAELHSTSSCLPYLRGLTDGIEVATIEGTPPFCTPDGVTNGQGEKILVKFIRDNPDKAHFSTSVLYLYAMKKAFPGPKK